MGAMRRVLKDLRKLDDENSREGIAALVERTGAGDPPDDVTGAQERSRLTRVSRTRMRIFMAFLRLAHSPYRRPLTVATVCKKANVSQAAFYKQAPFAVDASGDPKSGMEGLLLAAVQRIAKTCQRALRHELSSIDDVERPERMTHATIILVQLMSRYPHIFDVEGIIPRAVILALSEPLVDAFVWDGELTDDERAEVEALAKYHVTALIGIMRSGLTQDYKRIAAVMVSQIVPVLLEGDVTLMDKCAALVSSASLPSILRIASMQSFDKLARNVIL